MFKNKTVQKVLLALIFIAIIVFIFANLPSSIGLFKNIFKVLAPILLGVAIAFIINIPLKRLERLWNLIFKKKLESKLVNKLRRPVCLVLCIIFVICIIAGLLFMLIPQIGKTINGFISKLPEYVTQIKGWWEALVAWLAEYSITLPHWELDSAKIIETVTNFLTSSDTDLLGSSIAFAGSVFTLIFDLVLATVLSIYIIDHKEKLVQQTKRGLTAFFSEKTVNRTFDIMLLVNRTFANFLSGQLIEAVILGVLCFIGMLIFRMPYAALISTMVGVTALIPIFGGFIGAGIGAFFILLENPIMALWFIVYIIVLQQLEGNLIYPKVVGKKVGLPGLWVLVAVTVGSSFGIVGMLISVPICSVLYCLMDQLINYYEMKKAGNVGDDVSPFAILPEDDEDEIGNKREKSKIRISFRRTKEKKEKKATECKCTDGATKKKKKRTVTVKVKVENGEKAEEANEENADAEKENASSENVTNG